MHTLRYDTIEEFNVDSIADCDQLNLTHETNTNNARAHLVQYRLKVRGGRRSSVDTVSSVYRCAMFICCLAVLHNTVCLISVQQLVFVKPQLC